MASAPPARRTGQESRGQESPSKAATTKVLLFVLLVFTDGISGCDAVEGGRPAEEGEAEGWGGGSLAGRAAAGALPGALPGADGLKHAAATLLQHVLLRGGAVNKVSSSMQSYWSRPRRAHSVHSYAIVLACSDRTLRPRTLKFPKVGILAFFWLVNILVEKKLLSITDTGHAESD